MDTTCQVCAQAEADNSISSARAGDQASVAAVDTSLLSEAERWSPMLAADQQGDLIAQVGGIGDNEADKLPQERVVLVLTNKGWEVGR